MKGARLLNLRHPRVSQILRYCTSPGVKPYVWNKSIFDNLVFNMISISDGVSVVKVTRRVSLVRQELLTLPKHMSSRPVGLIPILIVNKFTWKTGTSSISVTTHYM
jgi:hypothetical protein